MTSLAKTLRFDDSMMWVELTDGRQMGIPLAFFPRLMHAQPEQLLGFTISGGGRGLHWDELNEDISVSGLLSGFGDLTMTRRKVA